MDYLPGAIQVRNVIQIYIPDWKKAQTYLNNSIKKYSFGKPIYKNKSHPEFETKLITTIRGSLSNENSKILHLNKSDIALEFVNSKILEKLLRLGPLPRPFS